MNGQTWKNRKKISNFPSLPHQISLHIKSSNRCMYIVLKDHLFLFQQDLSFGNRVRNL